MIVNRAALLEATPIHNMLTSKEYEHGVSHGMGEVGYDIRIKQDIKFIPENTGRVVIQKMTPPFSRAFALEYGRFTLASAMEQFYMPDDLMGVVHDKSSWARKGLSVFNTVIEPGWKGFLTLELVYHGSEKLYIPAGSGIAQVVFSRLSCPAVYTGRYQNQADEPVPAIQA